jgi:hypothetical protein
MEMINSNNYITVQNYLNLQFDDKCKTDIQEHISIQISSQEQERDRIARDLHDSVGAYLLGASLILSTIENRSAEIEEALCLITTCHQQIRSISHNLSNGKIGETPFNELVDGFLKRTQQITNLSIEKTIDNNIQWYNINKDFLVALFRIIQELTSNIIRHSKALTMIISISHSKQWLDLEIADNGVGFDIKNNLIGIGLRNVVLRIKAFEGQIQIVSEVSKGTNIKIKFPLKNDNAIFNR